MMGMFNFAYLTAFYKTANKILRSVIMGMISLTLCIGVFETAAQYVSSPLSMYLDDSSASGMVMQLPVLFGGMVFFAVANVVAYHISAKRFERLDL